MSHRTRLATLATPLLALLLGACATGAAPTGGTSPSPIGTQAVPSPSAPETAAPETATPAAEPSVEAPSGQIPSFEIPSFTVPSFAPDPTLDAAIPDTIDGQPVTAQTGNLMAMMQGFGAEEEDIQDFVTASGSVGVDPNAISFGFASVTLNDESESFSAIRAPGMTNPQALIQAYQAISGETPPTISQGTLAGRPVLLSTDAAGDVTWIYVTGEILFVLEEMEQTTAETIVSALP